MDIAFLTTNYSLPTISTYYLLPTHSSFLIPASSFQRGERFPIQSIAPDHNNNLWQSRNSVLPILALMNWLKRCSILDYKLPATYSFYLLPTTDYLLIPHFSFLCGKIIPILSMNPDHNNDLWQSRNSVLPIPTLINWLKRCRFHDYPLPSIPTYYILPTTHSFLIPHLSLLISRTQKSLTQFLVWGFRKTAAIYSPTKLQYHRRGQA